MKNSLAILVCFALGAAGGALHALPSWLQHPQALYAALIALLFLVGLSVGGSPRTWEMVRRMNARIILIPGTIVLGTLIGVSLVAPLLADVSLRDALAVGSGLGYYSLSSILITELHGERLGVIALLANVMREVLTLLLAPLLVRYLGKLAPIAAGGATSMDTTLPVVTRFSGPEYTTLAVFSGLVLMVLVPFLVTLILNV
ncbi:MAG TPA: lysine exporter LysO family protein [Candidatus Binatia bacterium]|nr:lysine exporter LysO family protein [Candidatus Binatia bacterium]